MNNLGNQLRKDYKNNDLHSATLCMSINPVVIPEMTYELAAFMSSALHTYLKKFN